MKSGDSMPLINFKLYKDNEKYYDLKDIDAFFEDNIIKFLIEDINMSFELQEYGCIFTRENDEFRFILDVIEQQATYLLKETNTLLDIIVERCNFKRRKDIIVIEYQLETDDCINKIELEIGE